MKTKILFSLVFVLSLASCIKEEPPFREADITKFSMPDSIMGTVIYGADVITVMVYDTAGFSNKKIAPQIEVSEGATIFPESGDSVTLDSYRAVYKITPQDGSKPKSYIVQIVPYELLKYDFESWDTISYLEGRRDYQRLEDRSWINGNVGIAIIYSDNTPYPTRATTDSHSGNYAAHLETVNGKPIFKAPLFAGSLYRGILALNYTNPSKSALFGQLLPKYLGKPTALKGFYKYKPGEMFKEPNDKNQLVDVPGRVDECDIYAVIFKVTKGADGREEYLNATEIKMSDKVVAIAQVDDYGAKENFTKFDVPFVYKEEMDYSKYDYKMTVSFTSSKEGAFFKGALGSVLIVDDVEVVSVPHD